VVFVIRLNHVETAGLAKKMRLLRSLRECGVVVVVKEPHLIVEIDAGDHDVQVSIAIQVIHDGTSGPAEQVQSELRRDIRESLDVIIRSETCRVYPPLTRDTVWILAQCHRCNVEKPANL